MSEEAVLELQYKSESPGGGFVKLKITGPKSFAFSGSRVEPRTSLCQQVSRNATSADPGTTR